jgi:hypothetical protein
VSLSSVGTSQGSYQRTKSTAQISQADLLAAAVTIAGSSRTDRQQQTKKKNGDQGSSEYGLHA